MGFLASTYIQFIFLSFLFFVFSFFIEGVTSTLISYHFSLHLKPLILSNNSSLFLPSSLKKEKEKEKKKKNHLT